MGWITEPQRCLWNKNSKEGNNGQKEKLTEEEEK